MTVAIEGVARLEGRPRKPAHLEGPYRDPGHGASAFLEKRKPKFIGRQSCPRAQLVMREW
ncbi:MAG TPA: hypothetical protein VFU39_05250 [Sulfuricaulis sp.]|nr:hypothetical protein [Sulfuricaulis sp.]